MSKKSEFKNDLERISKVFFLCKESYLVLRELYKTEDNSEYLIDLKYNDSFFTLTKVNYWRVIVLQLSKIFLERERYNILNFLEKCKEGKYYSSLNLSNNFINERLKILSSKQYLIDDLKIQRDKVFAHEDSSNEEIINNVTLDETKDMIEFCQAIIFHIYQEVYDTHYDFDMGNSPQSNLQYILESLDERETHREEERKNWFSN